MAGAIDIWCNMFTPEGIRKYFLEPEGIRFAFKLFGREHHLVGHPVEEFTSMLDEAGVEKVLIPSFKVTRYRGEMLQNCPTEEVAQVVSQAPDRLIGIVGINPFRVMEAVRELEKGVKEYGFKGALIHPYGYGEPLNHRMYYPIYAKCCELDVPVMMQVGHSAERMPSIVGHPIHIDDIALDFPELRIIGAHTGWPWTEVMIAMSWKHPNVYIGTTAHAPRYWEPTLVRFINTRGRDKVLFGTDYPVLLHKECLTQIADLALREESEAKLLQENAIRVFKL
jgi:predicted TIM-barrel fold metal-dependent hydrolase